MKKTNEFGDLGVLGTTVEVSYQLFLVTEETAEAHELSKENLGKIALVYYVNSFLHMFDDLGYEFFESWEEAHEYLGYYFEDWKITYEHYEKED